MKVRANLINTYVVSGTVWSNILTLHLGVVGNIILQVRRLRLRDAIYPKVIQLGYGEARI